MTTANTYTLSEAQTALKGKHFHRHETITDFVETFRIRSLRPADTKGHYRLIGKNAEHTISGATLIRLLRDGQCHAHNESYLITDPR